MNLDCMALSKTLSQFVGVPVRVAGGDFVNKESLYAEERELVVRAVASRRAEFFSGRFYAQRLLRELDCPAMPILRGSKGEPLWPEGVLGSISHDLGQVVVAVLSEKLICGFGVDLLIDPARVDSSLADLIVLPIELDALASIAEQIPVLALAFSLKESVVKAVSPSIEGYMDLHEIELTVTGSEIHARIANRNLTLRCKIMPLKNGLLTAAVLDN